MCAYPRRPPGNFPRSRSASGHSMISRLCVMVILTCLSLRAIAYEMEIQHSDYSSPLFKRMARKGDISVDRRDPPRRPVALLGRRQDSGSSVISTISPASTATFSELSSTSALQTSASHDDMSTASAGAPSLPTTTNVPDSSNLIVTTSSSSTGQASLPSVTVMTLSMPSPFDTSLGSNFTSNTCPEFFHYFLNNATFRSCTPISLLLQNSNSFFQVTRSPLLLSMTLERACSVSLSTCGPLMSLLASQLAQDSNCGEDFRKENPLVCQAHAGLVAYEPLFSVTCLKNYQTGNYCFSEAITNVSNPSDSYPYYTALGISMPAASRPDCGKCLQDTMSVFAGYAEDRNQPLAGTYIKMAQQIDLACGPTFANTTVAAGIFSGAASSSIIALLPRLWCSALLISVVAALVLI